LWSSKKTYNSISRVCRLGGEDDAVSCGAYRRFEDRHRRGVHQCDRTWEQDGRQHESWDQPHGRDSKLQVAVQDEGTGIGQVDAPSIEQKMAGKQKTRGCGTM
jgi:hypothetical protein